MTKEKIRQFLIEWPGYLKVSPGKAVVAIYKATGDVADEWDVKDIQKELRGTRQNLGRGLGLRAQVKAAPEYATTEITEEDLKEMMISLSKPYVEPFRGDLNNVLVIGDTHIPWERKGYLEHCIEVQKQFNCGTVVHIGDVIDSHYSSYHETNPDGRSAGDELDMCIERIKPWYKAFPNVKVCLGNHDQLIQRKAFTAGLSKRWIKGLAEVLEVPGWDFDVEHKFNDVLYIHGTGTSGENAAFVKALNRRCSVVSGHLHTVANIKYNVSERDRLFAMQVGCGVDDKAYAFQYAAAVAKKSVIACGVVLKDMPIIVPMQL